MFVVQYVEKWSSLIYFASISQHIFLCEKKKKIVIKRKKVWILFASRFLQSDETYETYQSAILGDRRDRKVRVNTIKQSVIKVSSAAHPATSEWFCEWTVIRTNTGSWSRRGNALPLLHPLMKSFSPYDKGLNTHICTFVHRHTQNQILSLLFSNNMAAEGQHSKGWEKKL